MQIDISRLHGFMSEPQGNDGPVDSAVQERHGSGMPETMGRDAFFLEGRTLGLCDGEVFGEQIVETVMGQRSALLVGEDGIAWFTAALLEPRPQLRCRILAERDVAFLSSFTVAPQVGSNTELDIFAMQTDNLRCAQSGLYGDQEQGAVAPSRRSLEIRRLEHRCDFVMVEEGHGTTGVAFAWHGQDLLSQSGVLWFMQGDVAEEGVDGGQAAVAGPWTVAAFVLEMAQEVTHECRVDVIECEVRRRLLQRSLGVVNQQAEGVPVTGDGMRACLTLFDQAFGEEHRQEAGEVGDLCHDNLRSES